MHAGLGAGDGLGEGEEEDEDVMDAFALELLGALDAFPGGGSFDRHAVAGDAGLLVKGDDLVRLFDGTADVEGQAGIDFAGDAAGHDLEDLAAEGDEQVIHHGPDRDVGAGVGDGFIHQGGGGGHSGGLEDERRVGRLSCSRSHWCRRRPW